MEIIDKIKCLLIEFEEDNKPFDDTAKEILSLINVSGSLRIAAQKLLDAVGKHHPQMAMDTQLDLYMAYHEVREALSNDD